MERITFSEYYVILCNVMLCYESCYLSKSYVESCGGVAVEGTDGEGGEEGDEGGVDLVMIPKCSLE